MQYWLPVKERKFAHNFPRNFADIIKQFSSYYRFNLVINAAGTDDLDYVHALRPWIGSSYVTLSPPLLRNIDDSGLAVGLLKVAFCLYCIIFFSKYSLSLAKPDTIKLQTGNLRLYIQNGTHWALFFFSECERSSLPQHIFPV